MINNILFAYLILTIHMLPSDGVIFSVWTPLRCKICLKMFVVFLSISRTCDVTSATFNGFAPTLLKFQQVSEYHRLFCRPNDKNNKYTHKKGCRLIKTNEAEDKKVDIWSGAVRITSDMNPAFPRSRGEVQHKGSRQRKQAVATICYRYISRSRCLTPRTLCSCDKQRYLFVCNKPTYH